jgi:hypothetical protein
VCKHKLCYVLTQKGKIIVITFSEILFIAIFLKVEHNLNQHYLQIRNQCAHALSVDFYRFKAAFINFHRKCNS